MANPNSRGAPAHTLTLPQRIGYALSGLALAGALSCGDGGGPAPDGAVADAASDAASDLPVLGYYCVPDEKNAKCPEEEQFSTMPECPDGCRIVA